MRKMKKGLALVLALLILLVSTAAMAEAATVELTGIALKDVLVYMDDELALDLTGAELSLSGGMDETTGNILGQLKLTNGDETAAQVRLGLGENIVLKADGVSKPLTLSTMVLMELFSEENIQMMIEQMLAELSEEERAAMLEMFAALTEMFSEENMALTEAGMTEYMAEVETIMTGCMTQPTTETYAFTYSETEKEAEHIQFTMGSEEFKQVLQAAAKFYDSNPAMLKLMNAAFTLDGMEPIASFSEVIEATEMPEMTMTGDVYAAEDEVEMVMDFNVEGETLTMMLFVVSDETENLAQLSILIPDGEEMIDMGIIFSNAPSEISEYESDTIVQLYYEDSVDTGAITFWYGPDADYGYMGGMDCTMGEESLFGVVIADGDVQKSLAVYAEDASLEVGYIFGDDEADQLYFSVDDGTSLVDFVGDVELYTESVPAAELSALIAEEGINVLTIDDQAVADLAAELEQLLTDLGDDMMSLIIDNMSVEAE